MARHTNHDTDVALRSHREPRRRWRETERGRNRTEQLPLTVVRPVARRALVPGTVVMAHVPFEETGGWKLRPAVVISVEGRAVTVMPATSAESRHRYPHRHYELAAPLAAGLPRATGVRVAPVTLEVMDVVSVVGRLAPRTPRCWPGAPSRSGPTTPSQLETARREP